MSKRTVIRISVVVVVLIMVGIVGATALALHTDAPQKTDNAFAGSRWKQVDLTVLAPETGVDEPSVKYDTATNSLSYKLKSPYSLTVSQQPLPTEFDDIEGYDTKFYAGLNQYATITTRFGAVNLVQPQGANGPQVAVVNSNHTLTFISSDQRLSNAVWQSVVNSFETVNK